MKLSRLIYALSGGAFAAGLVALVEARAVHSAGPQHAPDYGALALADLGVLAPVAFAVAVAVAIFSIFLEPQRSRTFSEHALHIRAEPVLSRSRDAAFAPLAILGLAAWAIVTAHVAREILAMGAPASSGVAVAGAATLLFVVMLGVVLALLRPLRRALAAGAGSVPRLVDPVTTGIVALFVALGILALGIELGDTGGGGGVLGIFGVLKRTELDLRPLMNVAVIALAAYLAQVALALHRSKLRVLVALAIPIAAAVVTFREAHALADEAATARAIQRDAPLGRIALGLLRHATDRDKDGASALFGGGDCDDRDARRSPTAVEVPDNGVDEDCSGADLHVAPVIAKPTPPTHDAVAKAAAQLPKDLNLVIITIDTLRASECGFMGYSKPTTPNLDALAAKSTVFDRMYAMASYTGKSLAPLFIGKYPSETKRDGGHFNTYLSGNTSLAERLHEAGFRTMGAASHWYFMPWSGMSQGFDVWDLSARPSEGQGDNDTSVTSEQLSSSAIRLLKKPENTGGRFFMWLHYFDPHEQYMPHPGAPSFGSGNRADYDGEVWFTDKHIGRVLDYIASQPWGAKTAIIVTADHGEAFGEHNMRWHGYELWEPLVRVPMIVYVPGLAPHVVPVKRGHVDLVPTALDVLGVAQPPAGELSGESLMPDLVASKDAAYEERDVMLDMPAGPFTLMRQGILTGTTPGMKLLKLDSGQLQLFDLANDPDEAEDLASDKEKLAPVLERFQAARAGLKEIVVKPDVPPPP